MDLSTRELILQAARWSAQAHGYGGLNYRELAKDVGIKAASIHYYFPSKADLGVAVAQRYREDVAEALAALSEEVPSPIERLRRYSDFYRIALQSDNRMCLGSFMAAEYDDLPGAVAAEMQAFADINVAWLRTQLLEASLVTVESSQRRAGAIFAAIAGAQLLARSRGDIYLFDSIIESYYEAGLLPM